MHPAASVIFFTIASGAGYGLLAILGAMALSGNLPDSRWFGLISIGLGTGLVIAGLLASTFHLGHPERAWRALSQWRSSWLSREGLAAVLTFAPILGFFVGWICYKETGGTTALMGGAMAVMAGVTVYCTGMIYASLKPIHQWHNGFVVPGYIAIGLMTGGLWFVALASAFGFFAGWHAIMGIVLLAIAAFIKGRYWRFIDHNPSASTPETATGLGDLGKVRLFEAPTTSRNFVMREMGYQIARKHATKLRQWSIGLAFGVPAFLLLLSVGASLPAVLQVVAIWAAAISGSVGIVVERWLFFAEAKHAVTLYYGAEQV